MTEASTVRPGLGAPPADNLLLDVRNLQTHFKVMDGVVPAVDGISFSLPRGQTIGIVGESGSGKSVTAMTIMRLLDIPPAQIGAGSEVWFDGREVLSLPDGEMRKIRGNEMAMIFQEPLTSLNPVFTVGDQIAEQVKLHKKVSQKEARDRAVEMLRLVGIPTPERRAKQYPHELSGGMRQRVMIGMALSCEPKLLIADEPTTALDVTVQAQILELLKAIQERTDAALMLITHDLGVVAEMVDNVVVMYAGQIVEQGTVEEVLLEPRMPYTMGLLESIPTVDKRGGRLSAIKGAVPSPFHLPPACRFEPRCPYTLRHLPDRGAGALPGRRDRPAIPLPPAPRDRGRAPPRRHRPAQPEHDDGPHLRRDRRRDKARMTTVVEAAPIADPVVRRKLRRRPPPSVRNGRSLLLGVAGYGLTGLFTIGLGVIIGVKGALGLFIPFALVVVPLAAVLYGITRLTRNRQIWSWAIAVGVGLLLAVISLYLIVTMQSRTSDANAIFFLQLLITPILVFAVASAWHFARGRAWFNGERERPLRGRGVGGAADHGAVDRCVLGRRDVDVRQHRPRARRVRAPPRRLPDRPRAGRDPDRDPDRARPRPPGGARRWHRLAGGHRRGRRGRPRQPRLLRVLLEPRRRDAGHASRPPAGRP